MYTLFFVILLGLFAIPVAAGNSTYGPIDEEMVIQEIADRILREFDTSSKDAITLIQDYAGTLLDEDEMYAFVADSDYTILAHSSSPDLVGSSMYDVTNVQGANLGDTIAASISPYGVWLDHVWSGTGTHESGRVWVMEYWGHIFGVGTHKDYSAIPIIHITEADRDRQKIAQEMVEYTIASYAADPSRTIDGINDSGDARYHNGEVSTFIIDYNGTVTAHGYDRNLAGIEIEYAEDTLGTNLGDLFEENISPYGRWVSYWWPNPAEGYEYQLTMVWIKSYAGHTFGAGMFPEEPYDEMDRDMSWLTLDRRESAMKMVQGTIDAFSIDPDRAISLIHDQDNLLFHDGDMFPIVIDNESRVIVAHGSAPELAGQDLNGIEGGEELSSLFEMATPYGTWGNLDSLPSSIRADVPITMLVMSSGGYTIGVGTELVHPDDTHMITPEQRQNQYMVQDMVEQTIDDFVLDMEYTIMEINSLGNPRYHDGDHYVLVVARNGTIVAHGEDTTLVGLDVENIDDVWGVNVGDLLDENRSVYGTWIEYHWPKPSDPTEQGHTKLTWIKHHVGYIFGAGIYID